MQGNTFRKHDPTVEDHEQDKIAALETGVDDYVTKPFSVGELHARLQALLRRVTGSYPGSPFRSGGLEVDLTRRLVKVRGRVVRLTLTEYNLLKALIQAAGRVLTHQQLLRQVWARPIPQPAICCG